MTNDEFQSWYKHHVTLFTGVGSWLAKFPKHATDTSPSQREVLHAWYQQLRRLDLADAMAASDTMANKPESELPRGFDRHPQRVRELVVGRPRPEPPRRHDGAVRCRDCGDSGYVLCWHPTAIHAYLEGRLGVVVVQRLGNRIVRTTKHPEDHYTGNGRCCVRCRCDAGYGRGDGPEYDPAHWCRLAAIGEGDDLSLPNVYDRRQQEALADWLATRVERVATQGTGQEWQA